MRKPSDPVIGLFISVVVTAAMLAVDPAWAGKPKISKIKAKLPPMEQPAAWNTGRKVLMMEDGKEGSETLVAIDGGMLTFEKHNGCRFSRDQSLFTPSLNWSKCSPFDDGTQTYKLKGDIWPLVAGKKWKYQRSGLNKAGITWNHGTTCKVDKKIYRVKTDYGEWDTSKVKCSDKSTDRTWYMSPEIGNWVYRERDHIRAGAQKQILKQVVAN